MKNQLIKRRKKIFNELEDNSILVLHSGFAPFKSADASYEFNVNHNFYYLAGIDQEDVTLVIGTSNFLERILENIRLTAVQPIPKLLGPPHSRILLSLLFLIISNDASSFNSTVSSSTSLNNGTYNKTS